MNEDIQEGDLVEVTAIGRVESVSASGVVVRLHGELVPFGHGQVKKGVTFQTGREESPVEQAIAMMPLVVALLREMEREPASVRALHLNNNVTRDKEREGKENTWAYWKPGAVITVILIFADDTMLSRSFTREAWREAGNKWPLMRKSVEETEASHE